MSGLLNGYYIFDKGYRTSLEYHCGTVEGYHCGIYTKNKEVARTVLFGLFFSSYAIVSISAHNENDPHNIQLKKDMEEALKGMKRLKGMRFGDYGLVLKIRIGASESKNTKRIKEVFEPLIAYLKEHEYSSGCIGCDKEEGGYFIVDEGLYYICMECLGKRQEELVFKKTNEREGKTVVFGILVSFMFSILGVLLWVFIGYAGYIAGFAGAAIAYLALKGYEVGSGKLSEKGVFIAVGVAFVQLIIACFITNFFLLQKAVMEYTDLSFSDSLYVLSVGFFEIIEAFGGWGIFLKDLLLGIVFSAAASFKMIKDALEDGEIGYRIRSFYTDFKPVSSDVAADSSSKENDNKTVENQSNENSEAL